MITKRLSIIAVLALSVAHPAPAQDPQTGLKLVMTYGASVRPGLMVSPPAASDALVAVAAELNGVLSRDLDYSDRFTLIVAPRTLKAGQVDYGVVSGLGAAFLVTTSLSGTADAPVLHLSVFDTDRRVIKAEGTFALPASGSPTWRMALHAMSDRVVEWVTGSKGPAASRIAFTIVRPGGAWELVVMDGDGENMVVVRRSSDPLLSPTWSPDGKRIAFMAYQGVAAKGMYIAERTLATGAERVLSARQGMNYSPTYAPDGQSIIMSLQTGESKTELYSYDVARSCCLTALTDALGDNFHAAFSPDGQRIALVSSRFARATSVFVMPVNGGDAASTLISGGGFGTASYFDAPDWSPIGDRIALQGQIDGSIQIFTVPPTGGPMRQITATGRNENPSWAPDGRHLVVVSHRTDGNGLYIYDTESGRYRLLISGYDVRLADWSPLLANADAWAQK